MEIVFILDKAKVTSLIPGLESKQEEIAQDILREKIERERERERRNFPSPYQVKAAKKAKATLTSFS